MYDVHYTLTNSPSVLNSVIWFVVKYHMNVGTHDASRQRYVRR